MTKDEIVRLSLAVALSTKQSIRFHTNFEIKQSGGRQRTPTSLPLIPASREELQLNSYLEYSHAVKALYIYKHPCLLRDSN
ncbi:hypothetical protein TNCV_4248781 [Trichonephila clavipes]|nr:hypothetical protein TNCV_4248781 [Trichonephila clavipes]